MEEKLLELFKLADTLNEKQENVYAQITYTADNFKKLEITIISKKDYTYVENIKVQLAKNSIIGIENIIELFESYIGGAINE